MEMKLSIIIPVYNEFATILSIIDKVLSVQLQEGITKEVIVIDDGSTDGTTKKLKEMPITPNLEVFYQQENKGKTSAVKWGIEKATGDIVLIQDADLEYSPDHYPALLEPILNNESVVVYGSRFKGTIQGMTLINRWANIISRETMNLLFGSQLTDLHTCFKVFPKNLLDSVTIASKDFSFDTEVTAKLLKRGHQILDVPIDYVARKRSEGKKITWVKALKTYFTLLKCRCTL